MLLPTTELAVLLILGLALLAGGSWTSLFTMAKRWRFELFYYDFALGFMVAALASAYTLGYWNERDLTFTDNFLLVGRREMVWVLGSGILLGLANLFLLAGVTLSGTSVGFLLAFGVLTATGAIWELAVNSGVNLVLATAGAAGALVAVVVGVIGYRWRLAEQEAEEATALRADPRLKKGAPAPPSSLTGPMLAVVSGILLTVFLRTLANGIAGENGVSPYGALLLLSVGLAGASIVFVPFFLYFPVRGGALQVRHYFKGNKTHHFLGLTGGVLGGTAILTYMLAKSAPANAQVAPVLGHFLNNGAPVVAALWGVFVWREFAGAVFRVNVIFFVSMVLLLASMGMIAVSTL